MAKTLSTFAIAKMLYVDPGSVANWIDRGMLTAHRTPGGHRRVATEDLVSFLRSHKMPVPAELNATPTRILVVDDEVPVAQMIAKALKAAHPEYEIIEANDGFRAGTIITAKQPDIVILDLRMPGMDGYEVCTLIRSQEATRQTEVLAMTAYPSPETEKRILDCGARVCISKPLDIDDLLKEVEASL